MPSSAPDLLSGSPRRIHLIGVAGSGMSGIAGLLLELGHRVSGSDKVDSAEVARLKAQGLEFHTPHRAEVVRGAELVVYSSAIKPGNPAFDEAVRLQLPMIRRADALAAVLRGKRGIVIAGMHGKTTTSAMSAHVLRHAGLRPSHYVGAEIPVLGTNAHWDPQGEHFVIEGDESDGTLALYEPEHSLILNIEEEHLDFYKDLAAIEAVYGTLIRQTRGTLFHCADDANTCRVAAAHPADRRVSFGAAAEADYRFANLRMERFRSEFDVYRRGALLGSAVLNVPGAHNVSNATGVIAIASELGVPFERIREALETFRGARRRFEFRHRGADFAVVDDYAHHPSELKATLATARSGHSGRIFALFQPHRYTRTLALKHEFGQAFGEADSVIVTDVYAASERPIDGVDGTLIVREAQAAGHPDIKHEALVRRLPALLGPKLRPGDLILTLGAGNIHEAARQLASDLKHLEAMRALTGPDAGIVLYEPLARHTTLRVGGPAHFWCEPHTSAAFAALLRYAQEQSLPVFVMGRGSNLLVRDGGIDGLVIHPDGGEFDEIQIDAARHEVRAGAGVRYKQLTGAAAAAQIGGFEWMEGIPGEVGGGLRMNAGAMGVETFQQVVSVRVLESDGTVRDLTPGEMEVHYREVPTLKTRYVLSALFRGAAGDPAEIKRRMDESTQKRKASQPIAASAGCIFKNPSSALPAGKLIDELGLKDSHVGPARVSTVHGNFIVNEGAASAREVLQLIAQLQARARAERGIELQTEVQIVGNE